MERNREARRGSMPVMNGGGLSRRRQRSSSVRDSPEEEGAIDMQETGRLRERGSKKDRDRERLSRNKRRRGDRMMHGSNREEGADTSDGSLDEDDDEEEEEAPTVRLPPSASSIPVSSPSLPPSNHLRKSFPAKVVRAPAVWKADEMIGVPIPRKARSGTAKRSHDCWASGGGSGGGASGEASHRQPPPTSPARPPHPSAGPMSPSSSNASVRKKIKPISGSKPQRPPKTAKSSSIQDLEIEVAEVLFGMNRQPQPKSEGHKLDSKEANGSGNDAKSRVSSPISNSQATGSSQAPAPVMPNSSSNPASMAVTAPKRKRPRPVKFEDESSTSPVSSTANASVPAASATKPDSQVVVKTESSSPRTEKTMASPINDNSGGLVDHGLPQVAPSATSTDRLQESSKLEADLVADSAGRDRMVVTDENVPLVKQPALDVNLDDIPEKKEDPVTENRKEEKFSIDLMAPPPGKLSPERDGFPDLSSDSKPVDSEMKLKMELSGRQEEKREAKLESTEMVHAGRKERTLDLQLDLDKHGKEVANSSKQHGQKLQAKPSGKLEAKPDSKPVANASGSVPVPLQVGSWPSNVPPFGYMGHVPPLPAVLPIDGSSGSSKTIQAPNFPSAQSRPSRCVTHCYIAQNIYYHQQIAKMNPFWSAAAGTVPLYGAKPYNLNAIPPSESASIPPNSMQANFPGRNSGALPDKGSHPSREKNSAVANTHIDTAQRKQHPMQQLTPPASVNNLLHGPAFIFSLNQQAAGAAASVIRSAAPKSTPGVASAASSSSTANFGVANSGSGAPAATVNFNYAMPMNEAHYLAILQNNAYPFQIPGAVGTPPSYRGAAPVQALPFFNGSFYSSQMLHPSQLQQQPPPQQASHTQHGHQNQSTSSGSSSSQKHHPQQPQQRVTAGAAAPSTAGVSAPSHPSSKPKQHLLPHQPRHLEGEIGCEDSPSTADSRTSQAGQKAVPGQNFALPIHPPNFALISPAAAALGGGVTHPDKQSSQQPPLKVELNPSQAFGMSFTSLGGNAVAAGAPPGLDFSSLAQNHAIFQSLPEAARQGYQINAAAAAAAASAQAAQHLKKSQQMLEERRSGGESTSGVVGGEEDRKALAGSKVINVPQQSLSFSRPDNNSSMPSILGNSVIDNSRTLTLIPANVNGGGISHRVSNSVLSSPPSTGAGSAQPCQQQQALINIQKQQQQLQHHLASRTKSLSSSNSAGIYSERMPSGSAVSKFPPALAGFPQALIQSSSASHSAQWKGSTKSTANAALSSHPAQSSVKTSISQQQSRISQQSVTPQVHQTQISFGMNSPKMAVPAGQQLTGGNNSMSSLSSAPTTIMVGSPQNSAASRGSAGGGSPRASANAKSGPPMPATSLPLAQQASSKGSPSSSSRKSSPVSNRNVPSILGQPHISSTQSSGTNKQQHQPPHQKQPYPQPQLFFSNTYMPTQPSQTNVSAAAASAAVAASYYQRRPSDQPPLQGPNLVAASTGMLSLCPSTLSLVGAPVTVDPTKAVAAATNMKGLQQAGLLQHPGTASFPYIHGMPSVSIKPAEQKPAAGNDNLNASWQAERR